MIYAALSADKITVPSLAPRALLRAGDEWSENNKMTGPRQD